MVANSGLHAQATRREILEYAMEHQFDHDDNALLEIDTDDPVLRAAARIINKFGGYGEIQVTANDEFLWALRVAVEEANRVR